MSRVMSFRLDETDPDEAQALALLDEAVKNNWTVRKAIVYAVLKAGGFEPVGRSQNGTGELVKALRQALQEARELAETLRQAPSAPGATVQQNGQATLKPELKGAIRKAAKKGFRLEE
jgi:hypothetical protein